MKSKACILLTVLFVILDPRVHAHQGRLIPNPIRNIPKWVRSEFAARDLDERYSIIYTLYPPTFTSAIQLSI